MKLILPNYLWPIFMCAILLINYTASAQTPAISGKVTSADGQSLPGVSVTSAGTTTGVVTNEDGEYKISLPNGSVNLTFSYIGYQSQTISVSGRTIISVALQPDSKNLNAVVVVGYGTQKKVNLSGAVSVINTEDLVNRPAS